MGISLGSPAHAGIDLRRMNRKVNRGRFPRTRGDRPVMYTCVVGLHRFPRTRGDRPWLMHKDIIAASRFPRTRGDRPVGCIGAPIKEGSPAHAGIDRFGLRRLALCAVGSPAHAGIDLFLWSACRLTGTKGSPAHAGIDLFRDVGVRGQIWFPRTRGDRPYALRGRSKRNEVPPHTRG